MIEKNIKRYFYIFIWVLIILIGSGKLGFREKSQPDGFGLDWIEIWEYLPTMMIVSAILSIFVLLLTWRRDED